MDQGKLVILSGPSGVGKDTLIQEWRKINPKVERVVAYTTRYPRTGEVAGVDYHFTPRATFERMARDGEFLEWKEVHGNLYATPLADMNRLLQEGKIAVLKIDVQGALTAMELREDAVSIFIEPPSWEELERRIRRRGLDSEDVVNRRLMNARSELALADSYHHRLVNDDLQRSAAEIDRIVAGR
jgi:guanylate kinase